MCQGTSVEFNTYMLKQISLCRILHTIVFRLISTGCATSYGQPCDTFVEEGGWLENMGIPLLQKQQGAMLMITLRSFLQE